MAIRACNLIHEVFPFTSSWYRVNYTLGLSVMVPAYMQLMDGIVIVALSLTSHSDFFPLFGGMEDGASLEHSDYLDE